MFLDILTVFGVWLLLIVYYALVLYGGGHAWGFTEEFEDNFIHDLSNNSWKPVTYATLLFIPLVVGLVDMLLAISVYSFASIMFILLKKRII